MFNEKEENITDIKMKTLNDEILGMILRPEGFF